MIIAIPITINGASVKNVTDMIYNCTKCKALLHRQFSTQTFQVPSHGQTYLELLLILMMVEPDKAVGIPTHLKQNSNSSSSMVYGRKLQLQSCNMGYFQVRPDSRVIIYFCRAFMRLTTGANIISKFSSSMLIKCSKSCDFLTTHTDLFVHSIAYLPTYPYSKIC